MLDNDKLIDANAYEIIKKPSAYPVSDVLGILLFGIRFNQENKENPRTMSLDENLSTIILKEIEEDKKAFYKGIRAEAIKLNLSKESIKSNKVSDFIISKIKYIYIQDLDI